MANDDVSRGLYPLNFNVQQAHAYRVSTAADIFLYMPVAIGAAGYVIRSEITTQNTVILGVAVGFAGTKKSGLATNDPFLDVSDLAPPTPSSDTGDRYVLVADDPNQEYLIQEDTGGTALALADIGASADLVYRGATPSTPTGNADSGWVALELDASTIAATTGGAITVLRLHDAINADGTENAVGDFAKWVVRITHHQKTGLQAVAQI
mgnify:CR=1 FL=1